MSLTMLKNARLADGRSVDLTVDAGLIIEVNNSSTHNPRQAETADPTVAVHDLAGWLALPAMAEPHAHLDKALTADMVSNPNGDLQGAINGWITATNSGAITHDGMVERARKAMDLLLIHGVTAVRTHVNVLASNGTTAVMALREAAINFADVLDLQIVALCGSPLAGPDGAASRASLAAALEIGVDLVGGCPHHEDDPTSMLNVVIDAALDAGIGLDLHVDEMLDPSMLTLRDYAQLVIERGFDGLTAASHCVTLGMQPPAVQAEIACLVAEANMAVVPLPHTNLFLQGRDEPTATPRGLTALSALQHSGVLIAAGADNVQDPFNLVGRSDPLETAALMVMAGHQLPATAYDMVSNNARRAMGLATVNFEVGDPADIVAIDSPTVRGAIADAPMSRRVFRRGTLVASTDQQTVVHR